jgi:hypothetical protein
MKETNGKAKAARTVSRYSTRVSEWWKRSVSFKEEDRRMNDCGRRQTAREIEGKEGETQEGGEARLIR